MVFFFSRIPKTPSDSQETSKATKSLSRKNQMLPKRLAANRPERDWIWFNRLDRTIKHSSHQWQQLDWPFLFKHCRRAFPLPHRPCPHFPVLVVVGLLALGAVLDPHFWANWVQGKG